MRNLEVCKEDLKLIGYGAHDDNDMVAIDCNIDDFGLSKILIREILKDFGEEYKIIAEEEYYNGPDDADDQLPNSISFTTNLPLELYDTKWAEYQRQFHKNNTINKDNEE